MKISDFASLFNLSRQSIHNYTKAGILSPVKAMNDKNEYTAGDIQTMIVHARLSDFGLEQNDRADLINRNDFQSHIDSLCSLEESFKKKLLFDKRKIQALHTKIEQAEFAYLNQNTIWQCTLNAVQYIPYAPCTGSKEIDIPINTDLFKECLKYASLTECEIVGRLGDHESQAVWQFTMDSEYSEELDITLFQNAGNRKEMHAITTAVVTESYDHLKDNCRKLTDYAEQNHLTVPAHPCFVIKPLLFLSSRNVVALYQIFILLES